MRIPVISGLIERRILANYHVDPDVITRLLPSVFRPQLVNGYAIAGICLIRLKNVRPRFLPVPFGIGSENAAHRIAVEWDADGEIRQGVYIPRRDTSSAFNVWVGVRELSPMPAISIQSCYSRRRAGSGSWHRRR